MENENVWSRLREVLSNVSLKTYLYAIGAVAVIIAILINVTGPSKYGSVHKDGKFYLNLDQIASDYGLDLNEDENINIDYVNNTDHNLTQDLSESLTLTTLFMNQNGLTNETAKGQILAGIILEYQKQAKGKIYTNNDLNIIRNTDQSSVKEYAQDINRAIKEYSNDLNNAGEINIDSIYNGNGEITDEQLVNMKGAVSANIIRIININDSLVEKLLSIPATPEGATYQVQLINSINEQSIFLKSLAYIDTDPMKYILVDGDNFDLKFKSDITSILNSFSNYFKNLGIN